MRLNQYIAHHSTYSRREADKLIQEGRVSINKRIIQDFSYQVENQKVYVNDKLLKEREAYTLIVYNKPKGELVSKKDDRGRKTIFDSLPKRFAHFTPIGRLDFASEGLLLLSDDNCLSSSALKCSKSVSGFPREFILMYKSLVKPISSRARK